MSRPTPPDAAVALRHLAVRAAALAALAVVMVLAVAELRELRGELALARFYHLRRLAEKSRNPTELTRTVQGASTEAELVMRFARGDPDALWEVTLAFLWWSTADNLDPLLRLRLGEQAVRAAMLAVRAAPSDYEPWLWLARAQASLGLWKQAQLCLRRAQDLAPPGKKLELYQAKLEKTDFSMALQTACRETDRGLGG